MCQYTKIRRGKHIPIAKLTFVDHFFTHLDRNLTHVGNNFGGLDGFINEVIDRNNLRDKTQVESLIGIQVDVTSQDHFHSLGLTNGLNKTLSTTSTGNNTQLDFGLTENSLLTSVDDLFSIIKSLKFSFIKKSASSRPTYITHHSQFTATTELL